mmetsp:Transcript_1670/g.3582  ORF Transcript_1670/g.3582 Transcript_1670/m.3582 type:complete len:414 (+) Transcript_1670:33-1274(+)
MYYKSHASQDPTASQRHQDYDSRPRDNFDSFSPHYDLESLGREKQALAQRQQQLENKQRDEVSPSRAPRKKPVYEPVEEYFPFGKPGAGAPNKKHSVITSSRPYDPSPAKTMTKSPSYEASKPTSNYDVQKRIEKEEQQRAYRDMLNDQIMAKQRQDAADKQRRLQEEQIEEAKIRKQLDELNEDRRREAQLHAPKQPFEPMPDNYEPPRKKRQQAVAQSPKAEPSQKAQSIQQYQREAPQSYVSKSRVPHEKFRLANDTTAQQYALIMIMQQMKAGAEAAKKEHTEAIIEFDKLRLELKMKGERTISLYESPVALASRRQLEPSKGWQLSESKFIPLRQAGASVLRPDQLMHEDEQDYYELSSHLAKDQLAKLDEMLKYKLRTVEPQPWVDDQDPQENTGPQDLQELTSYIV